MKQNKGKQFAQIIHRKETPEAIKNMMLHLFTDAQNSSGVNDKHPDFLKGTFNVLEKDHQGNINNDFESLERAIEIELRERPLQIESEYKKFLKIAESWEPVMYIHPKLLGAHIQVVIDNPKVSDGIKEVLEMQVNRMADWAGMSWTAAETIEPYLPVVVKELINKNGAKETANDLRLLVYLLEGQNGFTWRQYEQRELEKLKNNSFYLKAAAVIGSNKTPEKASKIFAEFIALYPDIFDQETIDKVIGMTGVEPLKEMEASEETPVEASAEINEQTEIVEENPLDLSEVPAPKENECIDLAKHLSAVLTDERTPEGLSKAIHEYIDERCSDKLHEFIDTPEYLASVICHQ